MSGSAPHFRRFSAKKDATYADPCAIPENFVAEILGGDLYASPQPVFRHVRAASALGALIAGPFQFGVNGPGEAVERWKNTKVGKVNPHGHRGRP